MSRPKKAEAFDLVGVLQWVTFACIGGYLVIEPSRDGPAFLIALALPFSALTILFHEAPRHL